MERTDDSLNFHEKFSEDFHGIEDEHPKSNKKKILIYSVSITLALALITTIFLFGYFKFGWFNNDEYDLDIKIKSFANQADYFTEKKTIKSKVIYSSGDKEEKEQIVDTNFVVILTDRKKFNTTNRRRKIDFINNATLVILDSKVKIGEEETKLNSFNIFDEKQVNEFETNPNGSKYPMAKFSYYENGTIIDINLPEDMDKYNAQSMIELIDNVVPKLSRSRKHDRRNGLSVKRNKTKKGDILTETQAPREYSDKYTHSKFKGSKYKKNIERDIQNEKIKKIKTSTNLILETQKEKEDTIDFGLKNFTFDVFSEIISTKNEEEKKEEVQLVKKLSKKLKFIKSDDLISTLISKEKEEELKVEETDETSEEENPEIDSNNEKQLRNLAFEGSLKRSWTLASSNILGKTVSLKYEISLGGGKLKNTLTASCGSVNFPVGNTGGTSSNKSQSKKSTGDKVLFTVPFPGTPIPVKFSLKAGGSIGYNVNYDTSAKKFTVSLTGELNAKAELGAGVDGVAEIAVGAKGTLISITSTSTLTKKTGSTYTSSNSITVSGGEISCYVSGTLINKQVFNVSKKFLKGWKKTFS